MRTIYDELSLSKRDLIPDLADAGHSVADIARRTRLPEATVLHALASALLGEGRVESAEALVRAGLEASPSLELHNLLLTCLLASPRDTRQAYFDESERWRVLRGLEHVEPTPCAFAHLLDEAAPLRVGFFCDYADTVFGPTALFPMFQGLLDRGVEVRVYDFNPSPPPALRVRAWHRAVPELDTEALLSRLRADRNHVLVDLNGRLRERNRYDVLARRVAPVQVNYFNSMTSAGLPGVDVMIAADHTVPPSEERYFQERIIRLSRYVNGAYRMPVVGRGPGPASFGHPFTFGSFNAGFKLNDDTLGAWARILRAVPGSRLYIRNHDCGRPRMRARLESAMERGGVRADRLVTGGFEPLELMYHRYDDVDLALDPFPHSGGSSSLHALWKGVPALAMEGPDWRGRALGTQLRALGLEALITTDIDAYVRRAVALATSARAELDDLRAELRRRVASADFYDTDRMVASLHGVFAELWSAWRTQHAGLPPAPQPPAAPPAALERHRPTLLALAVSGTDGDALRTALLENSPQIAHLGQGSLIDADDWALAELAPALEAGPPPTAWAERVSAALALADARLGAGAVRWLSVLLRHAGARPGARLTAELAALRVGRDAALLPVLLVDDPLHIPTPQRAGAERRGCPLDLDPWLGAVLDAPPASIEHLRWAPLHAAIRSALPRDPIWVVTGGGLRADAVGTARTLAHAIDVGSPLPPTVAPAPPPPMAAPHRRMLAAHLSANRPGGWDPIADLHARWPRLPFPSRGDAQALQFRADLDRAAWMAARSPGAPAVSGVPSPTTTAALRARFAGDGDALAAQLGPGWTPALLGLQP